LFGQSKILFRDAAFVMGGECQRHLIKTDINVWMMIHFLGFLGDLVDEINALQKSIKLECPTNGLRAFRPVRDGLQVQLDLFGMQDWHDINYFEVLANQQNQSDEDGQESARRTAMQEKLARTGEENRRRITYFLGKCVPETISY
jgi:hypothetical protein